MTKPTLCEIVVVMDRSGSMEQIKNDMMGGFDNFMREQKAVPGECRVSLYQFDDKYDAVFEGKPVADVPACSLVPRGSTALVDAVGKTINAVGERLAALPEHERPEKLVFLVITDGHENASHEFTTQKVREMIARQKKDYQWQFVYLGADAKAFDEAGKIGMAMAAQYTPTSAGAHAAYAGLSASVATMRSGGAKATLNVPRDLTEDDEAI